MYSEPQAPAALRLADKSGIRADQYVVVKRNFISTANGSITCRVNITIKILDIHNLVLP
jgi:hypothetical protein